MQQLDDETDRSFSAEVSFTCLCWLLKRRDGAIFGATDHDRSLTFGGVKFAPEAALTPGQIQRSGSLAPGQLSGRGGLSGDFLTAIDMDGGLWNGAEVEIFRVDWRHPERRHSLWTGRFGDLSRTGNDFSTELLDLKVDLERPVGDVYLRRCTAELGDRRCGVGLADTNFTATGRVVSVTSDNRFSVSGLESYSEHWFSGGVLTFLSGGNENGRYRVSEQLSFGDTAEIRLGGTPGRSVVSDTIYSITAGCDKKFSTCKSKFTNHLNFRGFPFLLGNDAVLSGPDGDGRDDGGSR